MEPTQQTMNRRTVSAPDFATIGRPQVTSLEDVQRHAGYKSVQPVERPPYWGVDLDFARRPGFPMMREPQPFPNTLYPPETQAGTSSAPMHGRPNKRMPPVFSTAVPLCGISGAVRRLAYSLPDHKPQHWLLKMFADRVDAWEHRIKKVAPFAVPLAVAGFVGGRVLRRA